MLAMQALRLAPREPVRFVAVRVDGGRDVLVEAATLTSELRSIGTVHAAHVGRVAAVLLQLGDAASSPLASIREAMRRAVPAQRWGIGLRIGVGASADCTNTHESWEGALLATRFARSSTFVSAVDSCAAVVGYEELGGLELLADLPPDRLRQHRDVIALEEIIKKSSGALDVQALEAFSRTGSLRQAAQSLYLHHSTVAVRLSRVEAATGWDLNDPDDRFRARFALWARRLTLPAGGS
jgi:sugar diacid utilization regulator